MILTVWRIPSPAPAFFLTFAYKMHDHYKLIRVRSSPTTFREYLLREFMVVLSVFVKACLLETQPGPLIEKYVV